MKRAVLTGTLLLAGGCELLREPTPLELTGEEVMVHSILQAGSDTVSVLLTRVRPDSGNSGPEVLPVSGAQVRITGGGTTVRLAEAPAGFRSCIQTPNPRAGALPGCYAATLPGGVRSGVRYELGIQFSGGEIAGTATVPAAPTVLAPEEGARIPVKATGRDNPVADGSFSIRWSTPESASRPTINIRLGAVFRSGRRVANARCEFFNTDFGRTDSSSKTPDSTTISFELTNCFERLDSATVRNVRPDSVQARLFITAFDTAYARYAEAIAQGSVERSRFSVGVTGALGVFAGAAMTERRVTLVIVR